MQALPAVPAPGIGARPWNDATPVRRARRDPRGRGRRRREDDARRALRGREARRGERKTAAELRCHETALLRGRPVDDGCLAFASAHFTAAFAHAERKGGCATTGDTGAVEAEVDAYVATLVGALPASTSTSTTTTTPTTTSTTTTTVPCADTDPVCNGSCATGTYTYDAGVGGCLCE